MAESIGSGNGSGSLSGFDIQAPNFVEQGTAEAVGAMAAGWIDDLVRKHVLSHSSGGPSLLSSLGSILDDFLTIVVAFFDAAQAQGTPGFFTFLAELLSSVVGIEISADHVNAAWKSGSSHAGFTAVGANYWNGMVTQLGSPTTLTPESGLASAQGFIGYLLGFSIREGNLAFLTSLIPEEFRVTDGIEEYARAMRGSLGLGRMARQALHPLIQTLITDPLQWYVNQKYTPKLLGESLAVRAYNRGLIDQSTLNQELEYVGYNAQRAALLQSEALSVLSSNDAFELLKTGKIDTQGVYTALKANGFNPGDYEDWLAAMTAKEVAPWTAALITDWKTQVSGGYITLAQFESYVNALPLLPDVKAAINQSVGQLYELPRKKLTLAEVQSAFVEGLLDSTDVADWLKNEGYSDADQQTLWFQTLLKLGTQQAKVAVAQYTYDKAVAKAEKAGEPAPPKPAILAVGPT